MIRTVLDLQIAIHENHADPHDKDLKDLNYPIIQSFVFVFHDPLITPIVFQDPSAILEFILDTNTNTTDS